MDQKLDKIERLFADAREEIDLAREVRILHC
jgi:hypothetical protein